MANKNRGYIFVSIEGHIPDFWKKQIDEFVKYNAPCLSERLEYVEQFDGWKTYKRDIENDTVGKIKMPWD